MKRIGIFLIEEASYIALLAYSYIRYSERFEGISAAAIFIIPAVGIAAVNLVYNLLDIKLKPRLIEYNEGRGKWVYRFTVFASILVSYASFSALEYFGNMPASFRTLAMISLMATVAHLMLIFVVSLPFGKDDLLTDYEYGEDISDVVNENECQN